MARKTLNNKKSGGFKKPSSSGKKFGGKTSYGGAKKAAPTQKASPKKLGKSKSQSSGSSNSYCGGAWVKEDDQGRQRVTFSARSEEDKNKLMDYLTACIEGGDETPFTLYGIENGYKNTPKAPDFVFAIPNREED